MNKLIGSTIKNVKIYVMSIPVLLSLTYVNAACPAGKLIDPLDPQCTNAQPQSVGDIIAKFVPFIPLVIGVLLFGMLVFGSFQVVTAGSNDDNKKKGFQTIQNAIIGAVIVFLAVGIVSLIEAVFGVKLLYGVSIGR